jgi:hypothetical protein
LAHSKPLYQGVIMSAKKLSTVTCHVINAYGNTAKNVIHAYRAGGERVVSLLDRRWNSALKQSRSKLAAGVAKNAGVVQQTLHKYTLKGLTVTSGGAQNVVNQVVKLADAGVHSMSANAGRFEDKTGAHVLSNLAQAALPGAVVLSALASQIEQKSAHLANKIAGDNVVVTVAKRARTAARKPRTTAAKATPEDTAA